MGSRSDGEPGSGVRGSPPLDYAILFNADISDTTQWPTAGYIGLGVNAFGDNVLFRDIAITNAAHTCSGIPAQGAEMSEELCMGGAPGQAFDYRRADMDDSHIYYATIPRHDASGEDCGSAPGCSKGESPPYNTAITQCNALGECVEGMTCGAWAMGGALVTCVVYGRRVFARASLTCVSSSFIAHRIIQSFFHAMRTAPSLYLDMTPLLLLVNAEGLRRAAQPPRLLHHLPH